MEGAWHFTHRWASGPATAIRVRVSCKAKLAVRRAASVIKLAGWPAKAVTGRQHQKQGPRETEELAALREKEVWRPQDLIKILVALLANCPMFWEPSRRPYQSLDVLALVMQSDTPSERRVLVKSRVGEIN